MMNRRFHLEAKSNIAFILLQASYYCISKHLCIALCVFYSICKFLILSLIFLHCRMSDMVFLIRQDFFGRVCSHVKPFWLGTYCVPHHFFADTTASTYDSDNECFALCFASFLSFLHFFFFIFRFF